MSGEFLSNKKVLFKYSGNATVRYESGNSYTCPFLFLQYIDGDLLCAFKNLWSKATNDLLNSKIVELNGITETGLSFTSLQNVVVENYDVKGDFLNETDSTWSIYLLSKVVIQARNRKKSKTLDLKYGLTNLRFGFDEKLEECLNLNMLHSNTEYKFQIVKLSTYESTIQQLRTFRNVNVTCELRAISGPIDSVEVIDSIVENICWLLSIATGTKVEWIYRVEADSIAKIPESFLHFSRITKPFSTMELLDTKNIRIIQEFVEGSYFSFVDLKNQDLLTRALLHSFFDAKVESTFLESRATRVAIFLEQLRYAIVTSTNPI